MKNILILIFALTTIPASPALAENDSIAWKDGWMAYYIDWWAVDEYHRRMDRRNHEASSSDIWNEIIKEAKGMEDSWNGLTDDEKRAIEIAPFWKSGKGEPRRLF